MGQDMNTLTINKLVNNGHQYVKIKDVKIKLKENYCYNIYQRTVLILSFYVKNKSVKQNILESIKFNILKYANIQIKYVNIVKLHIKNVIVIFIFHHALSFL